MGSFENSLRSLGIPLLGGALLLCVAAFFTALSLETSRQVGRLSSISNYDDVVYLNEVSEIYQLAENQGIVPAVHALFTRNLHAPFPVFAGIFGFVLFGPSLDRVYYVLAIVVFTMLAFVAALCRSLPLVLRAVLVPGVLALPFSTMCAQQFRPDMMWAVVLGGACTFFLARERSFEQRGDAVAFGMAVGLLLLIKPSIFAMTLLVTGGTWFLAAVIARFARDVPIRVLGMHFAITIAAAIAVAGWYWAQHARDIIEYFVVNSFGDNREVWAFRGSLWDQLTYYVVPGKALDSNLGNFFYPLLATFLAGAAVDLVRGRDLATRLRAGAFLWMLAGTCLVNAAFGMKSPFLGGSFYGILIFGGVWYAARLLESAWRHGWLRPVWRQVLLGCALLMFCAAAFSFPPACLVPKKLRNIQMSVNNGVLRDLLETSDPKKVPTLVVTQASPIVPQYLEIEFRSKKRTLNVISAALAHRREEVLRFAAVADYLLLQDAGMIGRPQENAIPAEKLQADLLALFRADHQWHLAGNYPDGHGKSAYLFQHDR